MKDIRRMANNGHVAALELKGKVKTKNYVEGKPAQVCVTLADLRDKPTGRRQRQLLFGDLVMIYETYENLCFVQSQKDDYVGYIKNSELSINPLPWTHLVIAPICHVYETADVKAADVMVLTLGAKLFCLDQKNGFVRIREGWIKTIAIAARDTQLNNPMEIAESLKNAPYLWGGNSAMGIDCSGLIQLTCNLCGLECPADSDMQAAELGYILDKEVKLRRGDLVFWNGHVAWVCTVDKILHSSAFHMATVEEDLAAAILRIEEKGDGTPICYKRLF